MTRTELKKIQEKYLVFDSEIDDVIGFVSELLHRQAEEMEEKEPYAWRAVQEIESAANRVWNLQDYIGDVTEE